MEKNTGCTCTYGAAVRHGGGTTTELVAYDPACPDHFPTDELDELDAAELRAGTQ